SPRGRHGMSVGLHRVSAFLVPAPLLLAAPLFAACAQEKGMPLGGQGAQLVSGRLLDEDLRPIAGAPVSGSIEVYGPSGSSWWGYDLTTDASGRFDFELTHGWSEG